jgi:hypothetical protein
LKHSIATSEVLYIAPNKEPITYDVQENTLVISTQACKAKAESYTAGIQTLLEPTYSSTTRMVYLFDLRKTSPDSIKVCDQTLIPNFKTSIPSGIDYKFYSDPFDIQFSKEALFDTVYFSATYQLTADSSERFTIGNPFIPLNRSAFITLKPSLKYSTEKVAVYRLAGNGLIYEGGKWVNGHMEFYTRELGTFTLAADTVPPSIQTIYITNQAARFKIRDNLSGIGNIEATLNGQWLLMNYDAKTATIMSERLNKKESLRGDLQLTVTDNAGNKKTIKHKIL